MKSTNENELGAHAPVVDFFHLQINPLLDYHFKVSSMSDFREDYSLCCEKKAWPTEPEG